MPNKKTVSKPPGIYVYCSREEKARIRKAAKLSRRSLSAYCMLAILKQVEADEKLA